MDRLGSNFDSGVGIRINPTIFASETTNANHTDREY